MSEGNRADGDMSGHENAGDRQEQMTQAQDQTSDFRGIGENGTTNLGDAQNVAGGNGPGGTMSGSAAGGTGGARGMEQEQPGYGSTGQQGYGDQSGAMGGSTGGQQDGGQMGGQTGSTPDGSGAMGQQSGEETQSDDETMFDEDDEDDLGDGAGASSAGGMAI